jgi:hypothetical protein
MKTQLEWDSLRNQFRPKKSTLSVHQVRNGENLMQSSTAGTSIILGEADFDLAYYANNPTLYQDKLPLRNCPLDQKAYIEIQIKTNSQEVISKLPGNKPINSDDPQSDLKKPNEISSASPQSGLKSGRRDINL